MFSALLRTRRAFGFTLAVSSGQELVTPAAAYARYALTLPETKVLVLVLEAIRDAQALRSVLAAAAARDVPVLLLTAGASAASRSLVAAHSGALAVEATAPGRPWPRPTASTASATWRNWPTHSNCSASPAGVRLTAIVVMSVRASRPCTTPASSGRTWRTWRRRSASRSPRWSEETRRRLAAVWTRASNRAATSDVWETCRDPEALFTEALSALADDPGVGAVALAVDLVPEYDGDDSYRTALLAAASKTSKPLAVLASIPAAIDQQTATRLRAPCGIPVLESTRTGLLALRHLLARATPPEAEPSAYEFAIGAAIAAPLAHSYTPCHRPHGTGGRFRSAFTPGQRGT